MCAGEAPEFPSSDLRSGLGLQAIDVRLDDLQILAEHLELAQHLEDLPLQLDPFLLLLLGLLLLVLLVVLLIGLLLAILVLVAIGALAVALGVIAISVGLLLAAVALLVAAALGLLLPGVAVVVRAVPVRGGVLTVGTALGVLLLADAGEDQLLELLVFLFHGLEFVLGLVSAAVLVGVHCPGQFAVRLVELLNVGTLLQAEVGERAPPILLVELLPPLRQLVGGLAQPVRELVGQAAEMTVGHLFEQVLQLAAGMGQHLFHVLLAEDALAAVLVQHHGPRGPRLLLRLPHDHRVPLAVGLQQLRLHLLPQLRLALSEQERVGRLVVLFQPVVPSLLEARARLAAIRADVLDDVLPVHRRARRADGGPRRGARSRRRSGRRPRRGARRPWRGLRGGRGVGAAFARRGQPSHIRG
mmetsp:Transcript_62135/g.180153  ORF Transcript_62135/g.180153 Transcript_62135/m.180153 type:complete len:414 (+) Transcript_62135:92-1333(+)